jgi:phosphohistidine phosphatase
VANRTPISGRTLILIRHAKSDWSGNHADEDRPLASRGIRQAPESGRWLARSGLVIEGAVVSPANRARSTWDLVAAELEYDVPVEFDVRAYTFSSGDLIDVVRRLDDALACVALVGHNPALEDLISSLTGEWTPMPTSAVAVIELSGQWRKAGRDVARLVIWGRPPAGM